MNGEPINQQHLEDLQSQLKQRFNDKKQNKFFDQQSIQRLLKGRKTLSDMREGTFSLNSQTQQS